MQMQPGTATRDPRNPLESIDVDAIWRQLTARYETRSLLRVQRWVESLFAALRAGAQPARLPKDPLQRPRLLYLDGIEDAPWFDPAGFTAIARMEAAFSAIHDELRPDLDPQQADGFAAYFPEVPNAAWRVRKFFANGERIPRTFQRYPTLGRILDSPDLPSDIGECQVSSLAPGGHIQPHYGPINGILVGHLAVRIPVGDCKIRVGSTTRGWEAGKCFVFDDTFEHEAWNRTGEVRYVVLFNLWHPDLTLVERDVIKFLYPRCRDLLNAIDRG
jgi:aspartate beta-hydroxylase